MPPARPATPSLPYRFAFLAAILIAFALMIILGHADAIDGLAAHWRAVRASPISAPCRLQQPGEVAHITVRLADAGELIATCRIVQGRS